MNEKSEENLGFCNRYPSIYQLLLIIRNHNEFPSHKTYIVLPESSGSTQKVSSLWDISRILSKRSTQMKSWSIGRINQPRSFQWGEAVLLQIDSRGKPITSSPNLKHNNAFACFSNILQLFSLLGLHLLLLMLGWQKSSNFHLLSTTLPIKTMSNF